MMQGSDAGDAGEAKKLLEKRLSEPKSANFRPKKAGGGGGGIGGVLSTLAAFLAAIISPFVALKDYTVYTFRLGGPLHRAYKLVARLVTGTCELERLLASVELPAPAGAPPGAGSPRRNGSDSVLVPLPPAGALALRFERVALRSAALGPLCGGSDGLLTLFDDAAHARALASAVCDAKRFKGGAADGAACLTPGGRRIRRNLASCVARVNVANLAAAAVHRARQEAFDSLDTRHELLLEQLWAALKPNVRRAGGRITKEWGEIGFQGTDPATDFRGMGVLGLRQLAFFADRHGVAARRALQDSALGGAYYPFAAVGINITSLLCGLLDRRLLDRFFLGFEPLAAWVAVADEEQEKEDDKKTDAAGEGGGDEKEKDKAGSAKDDDGDGGDDGGGDDGASAPGDWEARGKKEVLAAGKHAGKTFWWVRENDRAYCAWGEANATAGDLAAFGDWVRGEAADIALKEKAERDAERAVAARDARRERLAARLLNRFHEVYSEVFCQFNAAWVEANPRDTMAFPVIFARFREGVEHALVSGSFKFHFAEAYAKPDLTRMMRRKFD